jgi:hypothetical protein
MTILNGGFNMGYKKELIEAMVNYGQDSFWSDSEIIDMLIECGITEEDFKDCGYGDFTKAYFNDDTEN